MKKLLIGFVTFLIFACNTSPRNEFQLNGITKDFENGTVLYFDNTSTGTLIDSAVIEENTFYFNTKLPKSPLQVVLRTKDFSHYRFLWLENNPMTFDASNSDFRNAIVTGSVEENLSYELSKETDTLSRDERTIKEQRFVEKHPNSIHSAYVLSVYSTTWGKEKTKELYDKLSIEIKQTEFGKEIANYIKLNKNPEIGDSYVDFEMEDRYGEIRRLSEFEGKLVLLEFWGSGCLPCRQENPNLVKTYRKYQPKGFEIFAVSQDTKKENWLRAIEKDGLPWTQVSDLKGQSNIASLIYGISYIPDNFLIDQNGVIIGRNIRGDDLDRKLEELFN
ncbi:TlpA disulfide reductase family protein [Flagellimonas halotolerans]|uniref:TlpA disulfide reductase family protein n=1 Tax=Flagellimonas halotolerans TaxID=3112164 RepID=A0ABU6ITJ5_9FLAO|nr:MULTISPECIES: TlpA disulfide reductase family protein [unclassified Allomuricauda]MEC3966474.1 TlpA disulfide reductase family protein [Muricauda sp. SYSU M86414]MEC4266389.1 TlpA disulfide reductase family protein [Muricauda sp. SYSU M84420]